MTLQKVMIRPVDKLPKSVREKLLKDGKIDKDTMFVEIQIHDEKSEE